jgi:hypothetical protein
MRKLNSSHFFLIILFKLITVQLIAQQLPIQTFSLASEHFTTTKLDGLQVDWRLDLGMTAMALDQSNQYHFSAGFLQPSINRFSKDGLEGKYNPSIELRTSFNGDAILLFSKEPDLILFGYKIYNLHGQIIISNPTKYRSGYQGRPIAINAFSTGVYIMQVFYLPEYLTFDNKTNYWMKYIKFVKP